MKRFDIDNQPRNYSLFERCNTHHQSKSTFTQSCYCAAIRRDAFGVMLTDGGCQSGCITHHVEEKAMPGRWSALVLCEWRVLARPSGTDSSSIGVCDARGCPGLLPDGWSMHHASVARHPMQCDRMSASLSDQGRLYPLSMLYLRS